VRQPCGELHQRARGPPGHAFPQVGHLVLVAHHPGDVQVGPVGRRDKLPEERRRRARTARTVEVTTTTTTTTTTTVVVVVGSHLGHCVSPSVGREVMVIRASAWGADLRTGCTCRRC